MRPRPMDGRITLFEDALDVAVHDRRRQVFVSALLACGVGAAATYVAANIAGALRFPGYSTVSQTISELSAINAPSRSLWLVMVTAYSILLIAFGVGIWMIARQRRALRTVAIVLVADAVLGFAWPPMHLRGTTTSMTDVLHIAFTAISVPLMIAAMVFGAKAFGRRFEIYSYVSTVTMLAFGGLTSLSGPRIPKDLPTPFVGIWERISVAAFLVWLAVFAVELLREGRPALPVAKYEHLTAKLAA
jgi:hypothetical protein